MWTVRLHTIPPEAISAIEDYCIEAAHKDPTFKWLPGGIIECASKDQAYRRGVLFHHRFGCYFEVEWKKQNSETT